MATSGSFTGPRPLTDSPRLILNWSRIQTDIPGNRSLIRLTLQVYSQYNIRYTARKYGVLHGQNFHSDVDMIGTNITRTVATRDVWITHNSDGTKSQTFSATFDIQITWSGRTLTRLSVSGTANITAIPRKSSIRTLGNFTIGNNPAIAFTVAHSGFRHDIVAKIGNTTIQEWRNLSSLPSSLAFNATAISRMYNATSSRTSIVMRVTLNTLNSNGSLIGQDYKDITVSVGSGIQPSISAATVTEYISNISRDLGVFVQGHSRLSLAMTASGGTGSSVKAYEIKVAGRTYTSRTATTPIITSSGSLVVTFKVTDNRNRSASVTRTITIQPYTDPVADIINAYRSNADGTANEDGEYAVAEYRGSISNLNNKNTRSYRIRYRKSSGGSYTEQVLPATSYNSNGSFIFPADVDYSYTIQFIVTDYFTNRSGYGMVSSTFTLINFSSDGEGLAFGGAYDESLGGQVQHHGEVVFKGGILAIRIPVSSDLNDYKEVGFYYSPANADVSTMVNTPMPQAFSLLVERHAGYKQTFTVYATSGEPRTFIRNFYNNTWGSWHEIQFK